VSIEDVGGVVREIFKDFDNYRHKITAVGTEFLTLQQMADTLNKHVIGFKFVDSKVSNTSDYTGCKNVVN